MTKKFAAFFFVVAVSCAMMAGVSLADDRPEQVPSFPDMTAAVVQEAMAMLQTGN